MSEFDKIDSIAEQSGTTLMDLDRLLAAAEVGNQQAVNDLFGIYEARLLRLIQRPAMNEIAIDEEYP